MSDVLERSTVLMLDVTMRPDAIPLAMIEAPMDVCCGGYTYDGGPECGDDCVQDTTWPLCRMRDRPAVGGQLLAHVIVGGQLRAQVIIDPALDTTMIGDFDTLFVDDQPVGQVPGSPLDVAKRRIADLIASAAADRKAHEAELAAAHGEAATAYVKGLRDAAEEIRTEARWQVIQRRAHREQDSVDRLRVLDQTLTNRADLLTNGAGL